MEQHGQHCRNCQTPVSGEYCPQCGQREGLADKRFLDLAGDIVGDVFDADSRFWRTFVYLLLRPGFLSAEFNAGRLARYLPPLRLYLVISFVVFLWMSIAASGILSNDPGVVVADSDGVVVTLNGDDELDISEVEDPNEWDVNIGVTDEESPQWMRDAEGRIEHNAAKLRDDPNQLMGAMVDYLPQMMFLLLPVFALLIQLMYLGSVFHYLQHLVFALHYHSFVYLLFLLGQLLELLSLHVDGWLMLGLAVYLPLALRRAYSSGWGGALFKSLFVYVSYAFILLMGFALVAVLALLLI